MKRAIPSLLFALVLAVAAQALWGVAAIWTTEIFLSFTPKETRQESLQLLEDGTPVVRTHTYRGGISTQSTRTLDGRLLADPLEISAEAFARLLHPGPKNGDEVPRLSWPSRIHGFYLPQGGFGECWYAVSDADGSTRFVGYDMQSKKVIGYLGRSGFRDTPPPRDDQFPLTPQFVAGLNRSSYPGREPWTYQSASAPPLLALANEVVEVDLAKRKVASIWNGAGAVDTLTLVGDVAASKRKLKAIIQTRTHLHVLGSDYEEKYAVEIPEVFRNDLPYFYVADIKENGLTMMSGNRSDTVAYLAYLTVDSPPKLIEVPLDNPKRDNTMPWAAIGFVTPQPALIVAGLFITSLDRRQSHKTQLWTEAFGELWPHFWPALLVVAVASALLAAAAWRRQRRYGLGYGYGWAAFVFVFGVPGWFAYRWHRAWPPLEACPNCGAMAPRDRESCFRCGKPFPPPRRESIEIRD